MAESSSCLTLFAHTSICGNVVYFIVTITLYFNNCDQRQFGVKAICLGTIRFLRHHRSTLSRRIGRGQCRPRSFSQDELNPLTNRFHRRAHFTRGYHPAVVSPIEDKPRGCFVLFACCSIASCPLICGIFSCRRSANLLLRYLHFFTFKLGT